MSSVPPKNAKPDSDWHLSFPVDIEIEQSSGELVHRFIKLVTAFILDKRDLLPDQCFKSRAIAKLLVVIFNKDDPVAKRLSEKLNSLRSAITDKFLREFALVFYKSPNEEEILEAFTFRLMYNEEGEVSLSLDTGIGSEEFSQNLLAATFENLEQTKDCFVKTMKRLHKCIKNLEDLPEDADASFRISFTSEAPNDYMPEGFVGSDKFYKLETNNSYEIGTVCGGFHKVQMLAASNLVKPGRLIDLNQTNVSANQSILVTPKNKRKRSDAAQKKPEDKRPRPYGHAGPMTTVRRRGQAV